MKYKILGIIQNVVGALLILQAVMMLIFVLPQLNTLSDQLGTTSKIKDAQFNLILSMVFGIVNLVLGQILLRRKTLLVFIVCILLLLISLRLSAQLIGLATVQTLSPVYNQIESIN